MSKNSGYELSRRWFDFAFENKDAKCYHTSIYLWAVELNNRLGWKAEFGLPTNATMDGLSIGNKNTYLSALQDLVTWGFIKIIKESKNQFSATIIALCYIENATAQVTALDTALIRHDTQHCNATGNAIVPIDKPLNKETKKQETEKPPKIVFEPAEEFKETFEVWLKYKRERGQTYKSETSLKTCYDKLIRLSNNNPQLAKQIIEDAIASNYAGFFEAKGGLRNPPPPATPPQKEIPKGLTKPAEDYTIENFQNTKDWIAHRVKYNLQVSDEERNWLAEYYIKFPL